MSLRSEYHWVLEWKSCVGWSLWVYWIHSGHPVKGQIMPSDLVESKDWLAICERDANDLISAHMAAVTRSLGLGSRERVTEEEDEEQDRLAHKADHDNQCERDLEV